MFGAFHHTSTSRPIDPLADWLVWLPTPSCLRVAIWYVPPELIWSCRSRADPLTAKPMKVPVYPALLINRRAPSWWTSTVQTVELADVTKLNRGCVSGYRTALPGSVPSGMPGNEYMARNGRFWVLVVTDSAAGLTSMENWPGSGPLIGNASVFAPMTACGR